MMWTDDPVRDWDRHCAEQERELESLPVCERCETPLYEHLYRIDDKVLCEDCEFDMYAIDIDVYDVPIHCEDCGRLITDFVHNIDDELLCEACAFKNYGERN